MPVARTYQLERAVADAVRLVNAHSGQAAIRLHFNSGEFGELDFVANSATLQGDKFSFCSGLETFDGRISELAHINAELIRH